MTDRLFRIIKDLMRAKQYKVYRLPAPFEPPRNIRMLCFAVYWEKLLNYFSQHIKQKATAGVSCIMLLTSEKKVSTLQIHDSK